MEPNECDWPAAAAGTPTVETTCCYCYDPFAATVPFLFTMIFAWWYGGPPEVLD